MLLKEVGIDVGCRKHCVIQMAGYPAACGRRAPSERSRRQSRPSNSAANVVGDIRITIRNPEPHELAHDALLTALPHPATRFARRQGVSLAKTAMPMVGLPTRRLMFPRHLRHLRPGRRIFGNNPRPLSFRTYATTPRSFNHFKPADCLDR